MQGCHASGEGVQGCHASGEAGGGTHSCGRRRHRCGRQQDFNSEDDANDESWAPPPGAEVSEEAAAAAPPTGERRPVRSTRARAAAASADPCSVPNSAGDAGPASASPTATVSLGAKSAALAAAEHPDTLGDVSRAPAPGCCRADHNYSDVEIPLSAESALRPLSALLAGAAAPGNGIAGRQADCHGLVQGSAPPPSDPRLVPTSRTVRGYDNLESDEALFSGTADEDDDDIPLIMRAKAAKRGRPSDSSRESESDGSESDESDDIPLNQRASKRGHPRDSCGGSESDGSESNESAVLPDTIAQGETWSVDFCHDIHNPLYLGEDCEGPWHKLAVEPCEMGR